MRWTRVAAEAAATELGFFKPSAEGSALRTLAAAGFLAAAEALGVGAGAAGGRSVKATVAGSTEGFCGLAAETIDVGDPVLAALAAGDELAEPADADRFSRDRERKIRADEPPPTNTSKTRYTMWRGRPLVRR